MDGVSELAPRSKGMPFGYKQKQSCRSDSMGEPGRQHRAIELVQNKCCVISLISELLEAESRAMVSRDQGQVGQRRPAFSYKVNKFWESNSS